MKIAVTAPTGHIGSRLTGLLLEGGAQVTLLVRDPAKVQSFVSRGAQAEAGNLTDGAFVTRATQGADALFWLTPPDYRTPDPKGFQAQLAQSAAGAARANQIPRVVDISSIGAQIPEGTGPVSGVGRVERALDEASAAARHLRCAYFMENFLLSIDTIRNMGSIFLPVEGKTRVPMIATRDIADVAARILLDGSWSGRKILGLHGPEDLTFDEAAQAISEGISRPVRHVTVSPAQAKEALAHLGLHENVAGLYVEMLQAMDSGHFKVAEARTPETTTSTTLTAFAREVMKPLL